MKKALLLLALAFATLSAQASMIWRAVAVSPPQFEQIKKNPEALARALFSEGTQAISLDKDRHGIHFLLTGTAWDAKGAAGQAILGGKEFGGDLGYGPARVLSEAQVKAISSALSKISGESLAARFDPDAMTKADVYPTIVWKRDGAQALTSLTSSYGALASFYRRAAEKGLLVVIAML